MPNKQDYFKNLLKANGLKVTNQRIAILEVLENRPGEHLTAEEIYSFVKEKYPEIGLATVYKRYKNALFFIAVLIPSVLHGLYDCFCFQEYTILSIPVLFIGVFLLITYLNNKNIFYNQLTQ